MVTTNFSGNTVVPTGVPERMSIYASYDAKKAATAVLVVNKDTVERVLTLAVDDLQPRTITYSPMSINIVTIPDDAGADHRILEHTMKMAESQPAAQGHPLNRRPQGETDLSAWRHSRQLQTSSLTSRFRRRRVALLLFLLARWPGAPKLRCYASGRLAVIGHWQDHG